MMHAAALLLVIAASAPSASLPNRSAVAVCQVSAQSASGRDVGPKITLGWQFDPQASGLVSSDVARFHDPKRLLEQRQLVAIDDTTQSKTFFMAAPGDTTRLHNLTLVLTPRAGDPTVFTVAIGRWRDGTARVSHVGTCIVEAYASGADMMFDAISKPNSESAK